MITMSIVLVSAAGTPPVPSAGSIFPQPHCLGPAPGLHTANVVLHTLHTSHSLHVIDFHCTNYKKKYCHRDMDAR